MVSEEATVVSKVEEKVGDVEFGAVVEEEVAFEESVPPVEDKTPPYRNETAKRTMIKMTTTATREVSRGTEIPRYVFGLISLGRSAPRGE